VLKQGRREFLKRIFTLAAVPTWARAAFRSASPTAYPYIQNVRRNSASVLWTAFDQLPWQLRYARKKGAVERRASCPSELAPNDTEKTYALYRHKVELPDLDEGAEYVYGVDATDSSAQADDGASFQTNGPGAFTFLAFGDSGTGSDYQRQLAARIVTEKAALVLHTGDVGQYRGAFYEYEDFYFSIYQDLMRRTPFYPTAGNHDYATNFAFALRAMHDVPTEGVPAEERGRYYSFDWGNAHFVCLDSNYPLSRAVEDRGRMLDWLNQDLATTNKFWKIAYFHHPPYPTSVHVNDPQCARVRQFVVPILERHGAHLVLNGHEHSYQRTLPLRAGTPAAPDKGTVYVTTAGGGSLMYPVGQAPTLAVARARHHYLRVTADGAKLTVRAIATDGEQIDTFTLAPPPALADSPLVNATTLSPDVAPGGIVLIRGRHLATDEGAPADSSPVTELCGASVEVGPDRLRLLSVSPVEIRALLPMELTGRANMKVNAPNGSVEAGFDVVPTAPGIVKVIGPSGETLSAASALPAGETVTIHATGLGGLKYVPEGAPVYGETACPVEVLLQGSLFSAGSAIVSQDAPGVYQVPFTIPPDFETGIYSLALVSAGRMSNEVQIAVAAPEWLSVRTR